MKMLKSLLTWWDSQTLGTRIYTWRRGKRIGEDVDGNVYFTTADGRRRWVIYNGEIEASRVSPEWHGWLHHTVDEPPTVKRPGRKPWQTPHQKNLTGSPQAYLPAGSLRSAEPAEQRDYTAWNPGCSEGGVDRR